MGKIARNLNSTIFLYYSGGVKINKTIPLAVILLICIVSVNAQLSDIEEKLQQQDAVKVIVILKPEEKKAFSIFGNEKSMQDKVLDELNLEEKRILGLFSVKQDFNLKQRYSEVDAFAGEITPSGLEKLKNNHNVEGIYPDKKVNLMLAESSPLINADEVWNQQINGIHLTGEGQTVCIVDTGVDYKHPAIGSSQCAPSGWVIEGTPENYPFDYYGGSIGYTKTITKPGYSRIAVHFSAIHTKKDDAMIYIKDAQNNIIQAYAGDYADEWTFSIPGNTIKIQFMGPRPSGYGFTIDKVLDGYTAYKWQNCGDFIGGYDAVNFDMEPMDDDGHGTHVAGIITSDDSTYKGIAPKAKIVAVKSFDEAGWGFDSAIISGIDGCIRYADIYNISVISLSFGSICDEGDCHANYCDSSSPYTPFVNKAAENNILVVAASGNYYDTSKISEPACVSKATPVGSTGDGSAGATADEVSWFSDRWSLPMIFAPGASIRSTKLGGGFVDKQGTSMSAPHVSAVAALIYQYAGLKGIEITTQELEDLLIKTGKQIYDSSTGRYYKRVDALAAIEYLEGIKTANISLSKGWNLISSPLNSTNISEAFKPIQPYFVSMLSYDAGNEKFIEIDPFGNNEIDLRYGAWLKVSENTTISVVGPEFENNHITLSGGWNLIGYLSLNETDIDESELKNYTIFSYRNNSWSSYIPNRDFNSLQTLKAGYGYWVK